MRGVGRGAALDVVGGVVENEVAVGLVLSAYCVGDGISNAHLGKTIPIEDKCMKQLSGR